MQKKIFKSFRRKNQWIKYQEQKKNQLKIEIFLFFVKKHVTLQLNKDLINTHENVHCSCR